MSRFERWAVWSTSLLTALTGIVYIAMKYGMEPREPWAVINHPLQPLVLKLHIVVAPLLVFALGLITLKHVWKHWRSGIAWGRRSGIGTVLVTVPMVLTGYLIQVVTSERWLAGISWTHVVTGLGFALALVLHWEMIRRGAVKNKK